MLWDWRFRFSASVCQETVGGRRGLAQSHRSAICRTIPAPIRCRAASEIYVMSSGVEDLLLPHRAGPTLRPSKGNRHDYAVNSYPHP